MGSFRPPRWSDLGGTRPRMVEGRIMQEQLSRVMHGAMTEDARTDNND